MSDASAAAQGKEQQRPATWGRGAYEQFIETEGVPIHTGVAVDDLRTAKVAPWARLDAKGAYIRLMGAEDTDNGYLLELDPGKSSAPEKHLFEAPARSGTKARRHARSSGRRAASSPFRSTRCTACTTDRARCPRACSRSRRCRS
jgi:hypothetical protein